MGGQSRGHHAALLANIGVAVTKFVARVLTGAASMLAEHHVRMTLPGLPAFQVFREQLSMPGAATEGLEGLSALTRPLPRRSR